jgi:hypothetical protein
MPEGCSLEDEQRRRGETTMMKSGGGSSSLRERRWARESLRVRGNGGGCSGGCGSPFMGAGGASGRRE